MATDLQVTSEKLSKQEAQLTVKVPEAKIRSVARTAKIDGFRKGKVPVSHIRAQYGAGIQQEVINDEIRDTVFEAIVQEDIRAVGMPNIDDVKLEDEFLVYQATVEIFPEIEVQGLNEVDVDRLTSTIDDEAVDTMIESLREQRKEFIEKDGAIAEGDQAVFDFKGTVDDEEFEGGSAEDFELVIGSNQFIPGFEEGMIGLKAGEEKVIEVTFPEDYQAENLKGKDAKFTVNVKKVQQAKLPEIDEEFLKVFGVEEGGVDKLKADVRKNMEREIKNASRNQVKQAVFDSLIEKNEFEVPQAMLEQEIERQREQMLQRFAQQFGADPKTFDKSMFPNEMFEEQALRSARLGVIVASLIDGQEMKVDEEKVTAYINEMAENYEDPAEVIEYFTNDKEQRSAIESLVLENQVVDYILEQGKVTDKEVTYQELLATQQRNMM